MKQGTYKEIVYEELLEYGPLTISELSERLGLAPNSVKNAINNLDRNDGVIVVVGSTSIGVRTYKAMSTGVSLTGDQMVKRIMALGGGPFGFMAAQLGATA